MIQNEKYEAVRRGHTLEIKCKMIPWVNMGNETAIIMLRRINLIVINHQIPPLPLQTAVASTSDPGMIHKSE